jgi:hypothetical protein
MPSQKHIHTYGRFKKKPGYYKCNAPNCTHFIQKDLLVGKYSLCNLCGQQFILSLQDLKLALPRCFDCSNSKKAVLARKAKELTRYLGTEAFQQSGNLPFVEPGIIIGADEESEPEVEDE